MQQEPKWKQILEFPNYYISDGGRVINLANGKMRATILVKGKEYVRLWKGGKPYQREVFRLVYRYHT